MTAGECESSASSTTALMKVVLLGVPSVGKTSLFNRFLYNHFLPKPSLSLPGPECYGQRQLPKAGVSIALWDTAGNEKFFSFSSSYYRGSAAVIVCYDVADFDSLAKSVMWITDIRIKVPDAELFLCGCKSDLLAESLSQTAQIVSLDTERLFAEQNNLRHTHRVSSKTGEGVEELFDSVAAACKEKHQRRQQLSQSTSAAEGQRHFSLHEHRQQQPIAGGLKFCPCM